MKMNRDSEHDIYEIEP